MTEQWQELKETIIELRDNDGTATQQEVCKFLANYMDILEKQMQEPCDGVVSRQAVKEQMVKYGFHTPVMTVTEFVEDLPSVAPQPKTDALDEIMDNESDGEVYEKIKEIIVKEKEQEDADSD